MIGDRSADRPGACTGQVRVGEPHHSAPVGQDLAAPFPRQDLFRPLPAGISRCAQPRSAPQSMITRAKRNASPTATPPRPPRLRANISEACITSTQSAYGSTSPASARRDLVASDRVRAAGLPSVRRPTRPCEATRHDPWTAIDRVSHYDLAKRAIRASIIGGTDEKGRPRRTALCSTIADPSEGST